jgi:tRNA A37 N6-isopentenylltransferase MiaA
LKDFEREIPVDNKQGIEDKNNDVEQVKLMHELLSLVDPKMGEYLHSHDKRRIVNALFKYFKLTVGNQLGSESQISYTQSQIELRFLPVLVQIQAD